MKNNFIAWIVEGTPPMSLSDDETDVELIIVILLLLFVFNFGDSV